MTNAKRIIFLDMDGTIIDHNGYNISKKTLEAIRKAQENGHLVVIATGRAPSLLYGIPEKLGVDCIIAANGRYVEYAGKVIFEDRFDNELLNDFVADCEKQKIDIAFLAKEGYVSPFKFTDIPEKFSANFNLEVPKVIHDFHITNSVLQIVLFMHNPTPDNALLTLMKSKYSTLEFNISCDYGVDVNKKGGMKDLGIQKLLDYLSFPIENTIAIGDGFNDVSMIEKVGLGVAMGNACQPLKDAADFITKDVTEDGIYHAFKKLGLIDN